MSSGEPRNRNMAAFDELERFILSDDQGQQKRRRARWLVSQHK